MRSTCEYHILYTTNSSVCEARKAMLPRLYDYAENKETNTRFNLV